MTLSTFAAPGMREPLASGAAYRPGVCNIGSAEIARRRRAGHAGLLVAVALLTILVTVGAPPLTRLVVALPAAGAAAGYLQAWLRFCAAFGSRGVFNFDSLGRTQDVEAPEARARDRARAIQIGLASLVVGLTAGVAATLLPL
jgi:hypothetical protein